VNPEVPFSSDVAEALIFELVGEGNKFLQLSIGVEPHALVLLALAGEPINWVDPNVPLTASNYRSVTALEH
jgi:hypothetical protein